MKKFGKLIILLLSVLMILSLLVLCKPNKEPPDQEDDKENENDIIHDTRRNGVLFDSEEELTTFFELLVKDAEDLAEYDVCNFPDLQIYFSGCTPGTEFYIPPGFPGSIKSFRIYYSWFKDFGYFTVNDKSAVQTFNHVQYDDMSMYPDKSVCKTSVEIDGINYGFYLFDENGELPKDKPKDKLVKKCKLLGTDIDLYENTPKDLHGSINIGEFTVLVRVFVDTSNKEEINKINLEQFVWKKYYEEEITFDD